MFRVFKNIVDKFNGAMHGFSGVFCFCFRKCALISAHYSLSDVFDNLVISLCKFTTLLIPPEVSGNTAVNNSNQWLYMLLKYLLFGVRLSLFSTSTMLRINNEGFSPLSLTACLLFTISHASCNIFHDISTDPRVVL